MPAPLPTTDDIRKAIESGDDAACSSLIHQMLDFAVREPEPELAPASASIANERAKEVADALTDLWEEYPSVEDCLVDALWLSSSALLHPSEASISRSKSKLDVDAAPDDADEAAEAEAVAAAQSRYDMSMDSLTEIVKSIAQVPDRQSFWTKLQENLPSELLSSARLIDRESDFLKRLKVHNTLIYYKQHKYNLLQEESEGYSKLLQLLHLQTGGNAYINSGQRGHEDVQHLIGAFELDPNRVLDLIVDVIESKLLSDAGMKATFPKPETDNHTQWLIEQFQYLPLDKLPSLFHFRFTSEPQDDDGMQRHLYAVAFFISCGILDFVSFVKPYAPSMEKDIEGAHKLVWLRERRRIESLGKVSLSGAQKDDPKLAEMTEKSRACVQELEKNIALRVLFILLDWREWHAVKPLFTNHVWTQLCTLFPSNVGMTFCRLAAEKVDFWQKGASKTPCLTVPRQGSVQTVTKSTSLSLLPTVNDLTNELSEVLDYTIESSSISLCPALYCQICRLLCIALKDCVDHEGDGDGNRRKLSESSYHFFKSFLVPSLSLFPANAAIATELWRVLRCLPYSLRYHLYGDWRQNGLGLSGLGSMRGGKPLSIVESEAQALKSARYVLKRLSKDNIRDMSRQLAKIAHSNPLVVFSTILSQIETYDNMIDCMVEATRFVNPLGLDVLGYCILGRLSGIAGGVNRSRLKEDGVNVSQWLQSLEAFSGSFYKQCPYVEFRGMLSYLMRRLSDGQVMELGILKTLLKSPGGYSFADYSPAESLSLTQLEGRAGSISLMQETMSFGIVEKINHQAIKRIREVLQNDGFGITMLILIAQVRSRVVFDLSGDTGKSLKLIGNLYDSCQVVMYILLEFLTNPIESVETENGEASRTADICRYAEALPTFGELQDQYGFDVASAWAVCRPLVMAASSRGEDNQRESRLNLFALGDAFRSAYQKRLPESVWADMSPNLFEFFFMHRQGDLFCPESTYTSEIGRLDREIERIVQRQRSGTPNFPHTHLGSNDGVELERLKAVSLRLSQDMAKQKQHVSDVMEKLEGSKMNFFPGADAPQRSVLSFLSHCVIPRCLISPDDAIYCATFSLLLHNVEAVGFSTFHFVDELIGAVSGAIFGVTEGEAANLAILLWEVWTVVNRWRYDEESFNVDVSGKLGSMMLMTSNDNPEPAVSLVDHKYFTGLYDKWHSRLGATLVGCIRSSEYMHTRGALVLLTRLVEIFPTQPTLGNQLLKVLAPLRDDDSPRLDIKASANAYATMLLKARDDGKWIEEDAAVAQARVDKEKAASEARKKRIEEQFREIQLESEKITEEIGPRDDRRRMGIRDNRAPQPGENTRPRAPPSHENGRGRGTREPARGHRSEDFSRPSSPKENEHSRDRDRDRERERDKDRERDRTSIDDRSRGRNDSRGQTSRSRERDVFPEQRRREGADPNRTDREEPRGLGARWSRGEKVDDNRGKNKRSRPPSPEAAPESGRDTDEGCVSKRQRAGQSPPPADFDRRNDRGPSPPRRRGQTGRVRRRK